MISDLKPFLAFAAVTLVGLFGLFMAAHAELESSYNLGLGVFFTAVILGVIFLKRLFDKADAEHAEFQSNVGWMKDRLKK